MILLTDYKEYPLGANIEQLELIKKFDFDTYLHSLKVAELATLIGKAIALTNAEINELSIAALFHDIGKTKIAPEILHRKNSLSNEEWQEIHNHPLYGAEILEKFVKKGQLSIEIVEGVLYHHEQYNGKGYPIGKKGEDIPINARIITIADALDAMTRPRPYRPISLNIDEAISELQIHAGSQFDPYLVKNVVKIIK